MCNEKEKFKSGFGGSVTLILFLAKVLNSYFLHVELSCLNVRVYKLYFKLKLYTNNSDSSTNSPKIVIFNVQEKTPIQKI